MESYLGPSQHLRWKFFAKVVKGFFLQKRSFIDIQIGSKCASVLSSDNLIAFLWKWLYIFYTHVYFYNRTKQLCEIQNYLIMLQKFL